MLKKSILVILAMAMSSQSNAAITSEPGDSFLTTIQKTVFEFVYYGVSPLIAPVGYLFEIKGRLAAQEDIVKAADDMEFFAAHAVAAEPNEYGQIYKKVVIKVQAGEVVTLKTIVGENGQRVAQESVVESNDGEFTFDNYTAAFVKINGRDLVSDKLAKAHESAKYLIFSDVLDVPVELRTGANKDNTSFAANNAVIVNQLALGYAQKSLKARDVLRHRAR